MSTLTPISTQTLTSAAASVTFSGIPQTYTDLILVGSNLVLESSTDFLILRINGDAGSNYSTTTLNGTATNSAVSQRQANSSYIGITSFQDVIGTSASSPSSLTLHIQNYSNTTTNKTILSRHNNLTTSASAATTGAVVGLYRSTNAISSISVLRLSSGNIQSGSTFTLYGIGSGSPKAFGGDIVTTDGTYWYHTFNTSGVFSPVTNLSCDYLVVAGGGGGASVSSGGAYGAPGGGAGGYRTTVGTSGGGGSAESPLNLSFGNNYLVTVGAGGAAVTKGTNSAFSTITSDGGGSRVAGVNGGSGAGTFDFESPPGTGVIGQGFGGGQGSASTSPGGGGGAGGVGSTARQGGVGLTSTISGTSVGRGGGGGGGYTSSSNATDGGGSGGISPSNNGSNATANTGGGGGGAAANGSTTLGGNGGSGVVIIRYAV
jgi:hypothetical protein